MVVLCLMGWVAFPAMAHSKEIVFAISNSKGGHQQQTALEFTRQANAELKRRHLDVRIVLYDGAALGSDRQLMRKLKSDTIQLTLPSSIMASFVKEYMIFDLPFFVQGRSHVARIEASLLPHELNAAANAKGFHVLALWENGVRQITNNVRPIYSPKDLQGLTIRVPSSRWRARLFEHWGADTIQLDFDQVYSALKNGVVDGQENPYSNIWGARLYQVQKYVSLSHHIYSPAFLTVSKRWFNQLDAEVREVLEKTAREMSEFSRDKGRSREEWLLAKLTEKGMQVNLIDRKAFEASSLPIYEQMLTSFPGVESLVDKARALRE